MYSFVAPRPRDPGSRVAAYRWNGFGFSGVHDPGAVNRYSVIVISPERHPHVRRDAAERFARFLLSGEARELIARFGVEKYGRPLFTPREDGP